eukprot:4851877-Prymnesium_polylepis.3
MRCLGASVKPQDWAWQCLVGWRAIDARSTASPAGSVVSALSGSASATRNRIARRRAAQGPSKAWSRRCAPSK